MEENNPILCEITGNIINNARQRHESSSNPNLQMILDENTGEFVLIPDNSNVVAIGQDHPPVLSRKRKRREKEWTRNVRKCKYQQGEGHISSRGKLIPRKEVKTLKDCFTACNLHCAKFIDEEERLKIFQGYYGMSQNEKYHYILQTSKRNIKKRSTVKQSNKKKFSYFFNFIVNSTNIRVCKKFYLGTLAISQKVVYNVHEKKSNSNAPQQDQRGRHGKQTKISEEYKQKVCDHISSFPVIESHYCRASTKKKYLEPFLTISKMYREYVEKFETDKNHPVIKFHMYRNIFQYEFNLSFFTPKKDICDLCSEWEKSKKEADLSEQLNEKYSRHIQEKKLMRREKENDKITNSDILCFDLENVLSCPKAAVSNFYYKSKLNVYNLTAHFSRNKQIYCCIWTEVLSGRAGNDLASALQIILESLFQDNPDITSLIMWSDSCVPQNRNSLMSYAIAEFMKNHRTVREITIKYCTPGHSGIQEVDSAHSCIERTLRASEYYSPVSLMKLLKNVSEKKPYKINQLTINDVKDFAACAKLFSYDKVPYTKVVAIRFNQDLFQVAYKISFAQENWESVNLILKTIRLRNDAVTQSWNNFPIPSRLRSVKKGLPEQKVKAIKAMLKWMPLLDKQYYNALFREIGAT